MSRFSEVAEKFVGQKVAVMCARYQYRGVLSEVNDDCLILSNATSVEISGASQSEHPQTEDAIGGSVVIKSDAVEILYQPPWCNAKLPGE
jgi:hypothetical protein